MKPREDQTTLDPMIQRELDALEAALAGRSVEPDLADLADLATELQGLRATPLEEFASTLDSQAAAGFSSPPRDGAVFERLLSGDAVGRLGESLRRAGRRRRLMPALAGATTIIVVATAIVVATNRNGEGNSGGAPRPALGISSGAPAGTGRATQAPSLGAEPVPGPTGGVSSGVIVPGPPASSPGAALGVPNRKIERSAQLTLGTDSQHVQEVAGKVFDVVGRYGGIVLSSSVRDGSEGDAGATFDLLIPSPRLGDALADLSSIAEVRSRSENTLDITAPFVLARNQLREAQAEAVGLLQQLAKVGNTSQRASIKDQLRIAQGRIAVYRSQVRGLERRADLSRVSVDIVTGNQTLLPGTSGGGWTIADALDTAGQVLTVAAGAALVGLAAMLPLALLSVGGWTARRIFVRRAREQALGT